VKTRLGFSLLLDCVILLGALLLRLWQLDVKPAHFDEGVNGYFVDRIRESGFFIYDPTNYHGPLHFYLLFAAQTLFGREVWVFRLTVALASTGAVALVLWRARDLFGVAACRLGAIFLALSPAAVFVGRYAIHETWLVVGLLMIAIGGLEWVLWRSRRGVWWCFLGMALALVTKETWVLHIGCFFIAAGVIALLEKWMPSTTTTPAPGHLRRARSKDIVAAAAIMVVIVVACYTAFGYHLKGIEDFFRAFAAWAETGVKKDDHVKEWYYWLDLGRRYEWMVLLAMAGSAWYFFGGSKQERWLAAAAFGTALAYTLVPYKTPWCIASFTWPYALLGGCLLMRAFRRPPLGLVAIPLALAAMVHDAAAMVRVVFERYDDPKEPYVYVQTHRDAKKLYLPLIEAAQRNPQLYGARGVVALSSVHPVPWWLGDFYRTGYYGPTLPPFDEPPDFILVDKGRELPGLDLARYDVVEAPLRDGMGPVLLYMRRGMFLQEGKAP